MGQVETIWHDKLSVFLYLIFIGIAIEGSIENDV